MNGLKKAVRIYDKAEEILLVFLISVSVILLFINVILRYCFNSSIHGADEIAQIFFIWMSWLGISIGQKYSEHIKITILIDVLKGKWKKSLLIVADIITMAILVILIYYGFIIIERYIGNGASTAIWRVPKWLIYSSIPVSCTIMFLRLVDHICFVVRDQDKELLPIQEVEAIDLDMEQEIEDGTGLPDEPQIVQGSDEEDRQC